MKQSIKKWESYLAFLIGVACIIFSIHRTYENRIEVHPEIVDRYPKYFATYDKYGLIYGGIKMAFDACNGEACVPDAVTANLCPNPKLCVTRTRNFNYFVDYLDAIFFKKVTTRFVSISNLIGIISIFLFTFFGLKAYRKELSNLRLVLLSSSVLFISQILSTENILYRSGKMLTVVYISWLFYLFYKAKERNKGFGVFWNFVLAVVSTALLLSDEMAIFITAMCFIFFFYRQVQAKHFIKNIDGKGLIYRNAAIFTGALLLFYIAFRIIFEPLISYGLNGITIEKGVQTYSNFSNFFVFDFQTYQAVINAIFFNIVDSVTPTNNSSIQPYYWSGFSIILIGIAHAIFKTHWGNLFHHFTNFKIAFLIFALAIFVIGLNFPLKDFDVPTAPVIFSILFLLGSFSFYLLIQSDNFFNESLLLCLLWSCCLYLMGLRHAFVVSPAGFKATYYFLPTIYLFFLWLAIGSTKNNLLSTVTGSLILSGLVLFSIGNFLYSSNIARFHSTSSTLLILQAADNNRSISIDSAIEDQKFYIPYRKFFQGLTRSETSCFYNECNVKRSASYIVDSIDLTQKIVLPMHGVGGISQGERVDIRVTDKSQNLLIATGLRFKLANSLPQHCCLIDVIGNSDSKRPQSTDIASYSYENPFIEIENNGIRKGNSA